VTPEADRSDPGTDALHDDGTPSTSTPLDEAERARREADLRSLIELMRPSVQADGGDLELVDFDVSSGLVQVELRGACSSCAISSATLQGGVDRILRGRLDWVTEVRGGVDESMDFMDSAAMGRGGYVPRS
jgi:Fe-S cluster biogenesis protein NfuA